jgi:hypothetical protein
MSNLNHAINLYQKDNNSKMYHVFSDNIDHWTNDLKEAVTIARKWIRKYKCVRIYEEINNSENCIFSHGPFPA